jgi:hypothetical protein
VSCRTPAVVAYRRIKPPKARFAQMSSTYAQCPHETRPGTTVCLHCRHEELENARRRRRQFLSRAGIVALGVGTLGVFAVSGASSLRARLAHTPVAATRTRAVSKSSAEHTTDSASRSFTVSQASSSARDVLPFTPVIPEGRSDLGDSLFAVREGSNIVVHFDTPAARTRRRDKFEVIVRSTLPKVLGATGDSILARVPQGAMASGDLVSQLTAQGIRLPTYAGWTLSVWPETRPGQDGPLVVSYRLTASR